MITVNQIGILVALILVRIIAHPEETAQDYLIYACICLSIGIPMYMLLNLFWS